jgi:hypothetical protein
VAGRHFHFAGAPDATRVLLVAFISHGKFAPASTATYGPVVWAEALDAIPTAATAARAAPINSLVLISRALFFCPCGRMTQPCYISPDN